MASEMWKINPAFLEVGRLAYQELIEELSQEDWNYADGTDKELTEILLALVIINSISWRNSKIIYPTSDQFLESGVSEPVAAKLETIVKEQIDEKWLKENVKTTLLPDIAWGGDPNVIKDTAKAYLKDGVDGFNLSASMGDSNEVELIVDKSTGFSFPIYGFVNRKYPHAINKKVVL